MKTLLLLPWPALRPDAWLPGRTVLTPNARAALALGVPARSLEQHARERLSRFGTRRPAGPLEVQDLLVRAVRGEGAIRDPEGQARLALPVLRGWFRAGLDLSDLEARGPLRAQRLARLGRLYEQLLVGEGLLDPGQLVRHAAALPGPRDALLVTGYPRFGWDLAAYVEAVAGEGSVVLLPDARSEGGAPHLAYADNRMLAERLAASGWAVTSLPPGDAPPVVTPAPTRVAWSLADEEAELRAALVGIKQRLREGVSPSQLALVARDDRAIGPLAAAIAQEYGVRLRRHYQVSLAETRVGSWVEALLGAAEQGHAWAAMQPLLMHPLTRPLVPAAEGAAAGEDALRALRLTRPGHPAAWAEAGHPLGAYEPPREAIWSEWVDWLARAATQAGVASRAARWASEAIAIRRLAEALPGFSPGPAPLSRGAFARRLREALREVVAPVDPGRGGVSLRTPLSLFGARVAHLYVVGLNEGSFPAPIRDSVVLDFHDRAQLREVFPDLEAPADAAGRELVSFAALVATATTSLTLCCARSRGGKLALPSPYVTLLPGLQAGAERVLAPRALASPEERRLHRFAELSPEAEPLLPDLHRALAAEQAREGPAPHGVHEGLTGVPVPLEGRTFSVSQLSDLGQCPFRWFARRVLALRVPEDPEGDLTPAQRGSLYHGALELAIQAALDAPDVRAACLAALPEALEQARERLLGTASEAWRLQQPHHLRVLQRAVEGEDFLREGFTPAEAERAFAATWKGLPLTGKIDRIDRGPGGVLLLLDYKTGKGVAPGAVDAEGKLTLELQLPIYRAAAAPMLYPDAPAAEGYYYSLGGAEAIAVKPPREEDLDAFVEVVRGRLAGGVFPVQPDVERKACGRCDLQPVCRIGPGFERKEARS